MSKAQQLVGGEKDPTKLARLQTDAPIAPLAPAFGPLLRLTGSELIAPANLTGQTDPQQSHLAASSDLSLTRYLERVTAMRLKLQQIVMGADPDALSRAAAQAVLQGKTSEIADSREYASRVAASFGQQWAGFGALFEQPLAQTWQVVLQPAAASLNETWRSAIFGAWSQSLGSRYPFADSDNDASLPELARFLRPDTGVIAQFVTTQLAGVVERQGDRWGLAQGAEQSALTVDPAFLDALNTLTHAAAVLLPSGDPKVRFELRGVPTPGVTDMRFELSGRELHYFNQKEEWVPFEWPGQSLENRTHIEWQTAQAGVRTALDAQGRFGLIRLLERAKVEQQDSARYLLTWTPDQSQGIPLAVQLRSEAGGGPLDALALRHFKLPSRIFIAGAAKSASTPSASKRDFSTTSSPPPLPPEMREAAKHAAMQLPQGLVPGSE
jgi:type VI secretion system protein ImpL